MQLVSAALRKLRSLSEPLGSGARRDAPGLEIPPGTIPPLTCDESGALMVVTEHENDCLLHCSTLLLMTAKDWVAWMKDKNIHAECLLPVLNCNAGTTRDGKPAGNSPDLAPPDNSLSHQSLHESARQRASSLTQSSCNDDVSKFDAPTPRHAAKPVTKGGTHQKQRGQLEAQLLRGASLKTPKQLCKRWSSSATVAAHQRRAWLVARDIETR